MLYFSLLPRDFNRYFCDNYLAVECCLIWSKIYGFKELEDPYTMVFYRYIAKHGINALVYAQTNIRSIFYKVFKDRNKASSWVTLPPECIGRVYYPNFLAQQVLPWLRTWGVIESAKYNPRIRSRDMLNYIFPVIPRDDAKINASMLLPDQLQWIRTRKPEEEALVQYAIQNGYISLIEYAMTKGYCNSSSGLVHYAAKAGRLDVVIWLKSHGYVVDKIISIHAAHYGYLELIKWLQENNLLLRTYILAVNGWDIEETNGSNGYEECLIDDAADANDMELMRYLHALGMKPGPSTRRSAVENGNMEMLVWCCEVGEMESYDSMTPEAAEGGHFEILKWLKQQGDHVYDETLDSALINGHHEILEWIVENYNYPLDRPNFADNDIIAEYTKYKVDPEIMERLKRKYSN